MCLTIYHLPVVNAVSPKTLVNLLACSGQQVGRRYSPMPQNEVDLLDYLGRKTGLVAGLENQFLVWIATQERIQAGCKR